MGETLTDERQQFLRKLTAHWDRLLDDFFTKVDDERERAGLSDDEVRDMLWTRLDADLADGWSEWCNQG